MIMPKMGDAMEEGTLLRWLKSQGDEVEAGEPIAEIETDKVTMELEAEDSGTLAELYAEEGQDVPVGEAIAFIAGEGEEVPERGGGEEREETPAEEGGSGGEPETATATREEERPAPSTQRTDGHFRASPIVRRLARENNLDLSKIKGTGPQGRIVERDVRAALERGGAEAAEEREEAAPRPAPAPEPTGEPGTELVQPSRMQRIIGERMQQAKREIPHFYATIEADVGELAQLRRDLNERLADEGIKLSVNDFVMKACALALRKFPTLNALWTSDGIEVHERVDLAMAVALESGLITPVIRDAANKTLSAISAEAKDLASRARDGKLKPEEYQGGTFTVSNMGMFGVESFSAIINPPQAAIVAVSSIIRRPGFDEEGNVVPVDSMKLTLSADHRIVNGAEGAQYMAEVKRLLENPMLLVV
ncbi:dihydrolipoamide acetyltransferase family protein [Rubrobacter calidifluminis]|uniref:dihydrolipoamide acetyltransferase family protein n=1 Tax=Rubrobacter calidifluminis TaxID=1392640 RepID=UPI00235FC169|nr:dihydrolipoamide acetyltransferase family protein [Rubrobacter calidifluminis]